MKAITQERYGPPDEVLELREVAKPVVKDDEVLIEVRAASVHADVSHVVRGLPRALRLMGAGLRRPKEPIPGTDMAGVVAALGRNASRFRVGDEVFGECLAGHQWHNGGAFAEFVSAPERILLEKPTRLSFKQAAAVPTSGSLAIQGLRDEGRLEQGQTVLINGAGGAVGSFAVQLAKAYGARRVTAVDSAEKLEMLRSIGADRVIDYVAEDFTKGQERYDLIVDMAGNHTFSECRRALTPEGKWVLIGDESSDRRRGRWVGSLPRFFGLLAMSPFVGEIPGLPKRVDPDEPLVMLKRFIEAGQLTPVVDRTFPLGEAPEAIRYLEQGKVQGKIVLTI